VNFEWKLSNFGKCIREVDVECLALVLVLFLWLGWVRKYLAGGHGVTGIAWRVWQEGQRPGRQDHGVCGAKAGKG